MYVGAKPIMEKLKGMSFETASAVLSFHRPNVFVKLLHGRSSVKIAKMSAEIES